MGNLKYAMSPFFVKAIQLLLSLSLLVILHELGHFIPAKLFKTRVEKFFLFFDVKFALFKKKIGETEYGIGWLPLGGYVKISGMIDESMDTEQMKQEPQPWEFRSKPSWQRLIIMLGGVTVNFVLALIIYIGIAYSYGEEYIINDSLRDGVVVTEPSLGDKMGIETGDKIISVDGKPIKQFSSVFLEFVNGNEFTLDRSGEIITQKIPVDFIAAIVEEQDKARFLNIRRPFVIGNITEGSPNQNVGFKTNDQILRVNGEPAFYFDQVKDILDRNKGAEVTVDLERESGIRETLSAQVNEDGKLGVQLANLTFDDYEKKGVFKIETKKYSLL